jgi:hypothetical protein
VKTNARFADDARIREKRQGEEKQTVFFLLLGDSETLKFFVADSPEDSRIIFCFTDDDRILVSHGFVNGI